MPTSGSKNLLYRLALPFLAPSIPPFKYPAVIGTINANELPKYTGDFAPVHKI